jgi:glycosyltransferase involved in cell wall biosynthesis
MDYPSISVVIPTLNVERALKDCLVSVNQQDYPKEKIEIIVADGGSRDKTLIVAKQYKVKIFPNPLKTGEAGKAIGIRKAKGELVLLMDSDNILIGTDWLSKMVVPFKDSEIVAAEPKYFTARSTDSMMNRYCSLIGMNDPFNMFLGNYDRFNYITNTWTEVPIQAQQKQGYVKFQAAGKRFITMGANGFLVRRSAVLPYATGDYYFDNDVAKDLALNRKANFAKVDIGIIHLFADDFAQFVKKQRRRVQDFLYFRKQRNLSVGVNENADIPIGSIVRFCIYTVLTVPLIIQASIGYARRPDSAWIVHVPACWITLLVYAEGLIRTTVASKETMMDRRKW